MEREPPPISRKLYTAWSAAGRTESARNTSAHYHLRSLVPAVTENAEFFPPADLMVCYVQFWVTLQPLGNRRAGRASKPVQPTPDPARRPWKAVVLQTAEGIQFCKSATTRQVALSSDSDGRGRRPLSPVEALQSTPFAGAAEVCHLLSGPDALRALAGAAPTSTYPATATSTKMQLFAAEILA